MSCSSEKTTGGISGSIFLSWRNFQAALLSGSFLSGIKMPISNISAWKGNVKVAENKSLDTLATLTISDPEVWSPLHPFLYDLRITVMRMGKVVDEVKSYFAMRNISIAPDKNGWVAPIILT